MRATPADDPLLGKGAFVEEQRGLVATQQGIRLTRHFATEPLPVDARFGEQVVQGLGIGIDRLTHA